MCINVVNLGSLNTFGTTRSTFTSSAMLLTCHELLLGLVALLV